MLIALVVVVAGLLLLLGVRSAVDQASKEATAFTARLAAEAAAARTGLLFGLTGLATLIAIVLAYTSAHSG